MAWFQSYRSAVAAAPETALAPVNEGYQQLLTASERLPSVSRVRALVKALQADLVRLQTVLVATPATPTLALDPAPSFKAIPDQQMQLVLARRWDECVACLNAGAPLAATVMMGGLLESLLLARVNREPNKQGVFLAASAPKDSKTQQPLGLKAWTLNDYIGVAHELGWITQSVRDVSQILRDYRNYIHPQKELSQQLALTRQDGFMFWAVFKGIAAHLL